MSACGIECFGRGFLQFLLVEFVSLVGCALGTLFVMGSQSQWAFFVGPLRITAVGALVLGLLLGLVGCTRIPNGTKLALLLAACLIGFFIAFGLGMSAPLAGVRI